MSTSDFNQEQQIDTAGRLDKLAMALTGVCILHCLLTPIILTLVPIVSLNTWFSEEFFHKAILWLVIPTSIVALFIGCRNHRDWRILGSALVGIALLIFTAFFAHDMLGHLLEQILTTIAGLILAFSHYLNYRACQSLTCGSDNCSVEHHH